MSLVRWDPFADMERLFNRMMPAPARPIGQVNRQIPMRSDTDITKDVEAELRWSPDVDETDIAVRVNDGEVTLSGFADSYLSKYQAEIATRRIKGVTAVANNISVKPLSGVPADPQIARAAVGREPTG